VWRVGTAVLGALGLLASAQDSRACSHVGGETPPYLVFPRDGATDVPVDVTATVMWSRAFEPDPSLFQLRDVTGVVVMPQTTLLGSWGTGDSPNWTLRVAPGIELSPSTRYDVLVVDGDVVVTVGSFTTTAVPDDVPPGAPLVADVIVGANHSCQSRLTCCYSEPRVIDVEIVVEPAAEAVVYTIREGGNLVAADTAPPLDGLLACGDRFPEFRSTATADSPPEWWLSGATHELTLAARDLAGHESEPVTVVVEGNCANDDQGTGELPPRTGGGCCAGPGPRSGLGTFALVLGIGLVIRRRALVALMALGCSSSPDLPCEVPASAYRLASLSACPSKLIQDETHLYWTGGERLLRFPKCGSSSPPEELAANVTSFDLAVDGSHVYLADVNRLVRVPKIGGALMDVAALSGTPEQFLVDDGDLFATTQAGVCVVGQPCPPSGTLISRMPTDGGPITPILTHDGGQIFELIADDEWLYFTGSLINVSAGIHRVPRSGGEMHPVLGEEEAVTSSSIVATAGSIVFVGLGQLRRVPTFGGFSSSSIADVDGDIGSLAADASHVYFTSGAGTSGSLSRVPLAGEAPTILVSGTDPSSVAVDGSAVYFATCQSGDDAAVWIMAK
jgi:hypothetical protein